MEMFEAFGFSERVPKEAYWVNETSFWKHPGIEVSPESQSGTSRVKGSVRAGPYLINAMASLKRGCPAV